MMNRKEFRGAGFQGRRDTTITKGQARGRKRGSFLSAGRRPSILVSYAPGAPARIFARISRKNGRVRRTLQRMRAAGEEVML